MSDMGDLRGDIDDFFSKVKTEFGLEDEEHAYDPDEASPDEAVVPPAPARENPPASAVPEISAVLPEEEDETYPGSRRKRRGLRSKEEPVPDDDVVWGQSPRIFRVDGKEREFFPLTALATALKRKSQTMRKWELNGFLPQARYRAPGAGKSQARLYTRAQIEGLVVLAKEEGLMDPARKMRIDQTKFPDRAHRLFRALEQRQ